MNRSRQILAAAAFAAVAILPGAAHAAGCNGVVNIFQWGCAPWDNNNGSNYPYYRKHLESVPANKAQLIQRNGATMVLYNGKYYPFVGHDGAGILSKGGGSFRVWVPN